MSADEVVKTITIKGKTEGVDQATESLKKLAGAQGVVAVVSETAGKSAEDVSEKYRRQTLRVDEAARMQAKIASETRIAKQAMDQGLITQDQHAQRLDTINQKYGQATPLQAAFSKSLQGVQMQMVALSAGAGPVGTFLSAMGPWGLAAAAAIGAVAGAYNSLNEASHRAADRGTELRRFNESTGISIDRARAYSKATVQLGIDSDTSRGAIEKFVIAWEEARLGQGAMLAQLQKTDTGLAAEVQTARTGVAAFDALAAAIRKAVDAGNQGEALRLARAAGGRGGAEAIIAQSMAVTAAGGSANLVNENSRLSSTALDDLSRMSIKLKEMQKAADDAWVAFGGKQAMQTELYWAEAKKKVGDMANSLADLISKGEYWGGVWTRLKQLVTNQPIGALASYGSHPTYQSPGADQALRNAPAPGTNTPLPPTVEAIAASSAQRMGLLGSAATQAETLADKQKQLAATSKLVADGAALASRNIADMRISQQQANEAIKQSLGVSSEYEIAQSRLVALDVQISKGLQLTNQQRQLATTIILKEAKAQAEANQVRAAALPGLKQMELDSYNLNKAVDQVGTQGLSTMASSMADIQMGTVKTADGFRTMAVSIGKSILTMVNQMILAQTVGRALQSLFGVASPAPVQFGLSPGDAGFVGPVQTGRVGGMVGSLPSAGFIHPAYFENAPRMRSGGMITDDGVPIVAHPGERILNRRETQAYNSGGSGGDDIHVHMSIDLKGANGDETIAKIAAAAAQKAFKAAVATANADAPARQQRYRSLGT